MILAKQNNSVVGCIAFRKLETTIGEIKRMYVKPGFRQQHIGQKLLSLILKNAEELGYQTVRLDTLTRMESAVNLYRGFKFYEISSYRYNPFQDALFMERKLP